MDFIMSILLALMPIKTIAQKTIAGILFASDYVCFELLKLLTRFRAILRTCSVKYILYFQPGFADAQIPTPRSLRDIFTMTVKFPVREMKRKGR